jgi:hypothetical protein
MTLDGLIYVGPQKLLWQMVFLMAYEALIIAYVN